VILIINILKKSISHNSEVFIVSVLGLLQHVSIQQDHLQVIHISKIAKKIHWVMGVLYINEVSFLQIIGLY